jgi:D-alanine transaminase
MKQRAREAGVQEAIVVRDGEVLEGSSMNIFVVAGGKISTPPSDHRILPGITREVVLELARDTTPVAVRRVTLDDLRTADEVWLSSSTYNVVAVTTIDGKPVGEGKPGPLLRQMQRAFEAVQTEAP